MRTIGISVRGESSYLAHAVAELWLGHDYPVRAVWATTPGAAAPVAASARSGGEWVADPRDGIPSRIRWSSTNPPHVDVDPVPVDGCVASTATHGDWFTIHAPSDAGEHIDFVVMPTRAQVAPNPPEWADHALSAWRAWPRGATWRADFRGYAAAVALFLSRRSPYPMPRGAAYQLLLLAGLLSSGGAKFSSNDDRYGVFRDGRLASYGWPRLGYVEPLLVSVQTATLRNLCEQVPAVVVQRYGRDALLDPQVPAAFSETC